MALRPFEEAVVHAGGEASASSRASGHRQPDGRLGLLLVDRHFRRIFPSPQLLHIPIPVDADGFWDARGALVAALQTPPRAHPSC